MANVNRVFQVEMIGYRFQIVRIMVHIVAAIGLRRAAVSAPVSRNDAETFAEEEKHLRVPIVRAQRPAMAEDDRLPAPPVFIINVDVLSVFFSCSYVWHDDFLSV